MRDSKTATHKYWLGLNDEERATLLPLVQRQTGRTTANDLDKNALKLFEKGGMEIQFELKEELGKEPTVSQVMTRAREIMSGQRPPPKGLTLPDIRG